MSLEIGLVRHLVMVVFGLWSVAALSAHDEVHLAATLGQRVEDLLQAVALLGLEAL